MPLSYINFSGKKPKSHLKRCNGHIFGVSVFNVGVMRLKFNGNYHTISSIVLTLG
jgi:hypothetical protein